ncbi:MAG TPA: enoyl-CoA hydratase-related protein [Ignavibacteria bacterium]|nr:2-(1,2-epoxy-1,2-dihydrophenyl)acetyl-CoA isomerase [Bacteroidota bacterium]HRE11678.1 enoyl-CoA hydratase-related protein [Ignavibacteria bacterium]HRF66054.1 enoyl-CoA hydratase-related protein [Ignavibacteria bacterium]HRJ02894.1 enoyl-CoA hydratase-related protein [Ignavibacteria bacterium]HRJ86194.1 enoyl-CoA hydratase-related protein [Ignavibacteria bacterium]
MSAIIKELNNGILNITLNRPDSLNAFNAAMLTELQDAFKEAESDEVRCVTLTGAGKGFCSGQDLKDFESEKKTFKEAIETRYNPLIMQIMNLPKPVICGINGVAAGAGLSLALACDFRIATDSAQLIEVFINVGLVPDSGSSFTLPRIVGLAKAFQMCSTAERITGSEAKKLGLVNVCVQTPEVLKAAMVKYSKKFAKMPTGALGMIKELVNNSYSRTLQEVLAEEAAAQDIAGNSNDYKEGVNAFIEKRKPVFKGN